MKTQHCAALASAGMAALVLSGCVTAKGETQQALAPELAANGYAKEINVYATPESRIKTAFTQSMAEEIRGELSECATGETPLRVDVKLTRIKQSNPLLSAVITDTNEVQGHVTIYSLETGAVASEFDIDWENRGGLGAGGALMQLAMAPNQVTGGVAEEICRRAFEGETDEMESVELLPF